MLLHSTSGEDAARIAMTDDAVLAFLREHFTGAESTSLCPAIAGKKELGAREAHALHLPSDERVLMLYDDTIFGSGDEGFLVTAQRLCWKNAGEAPRMIEWSNLDPDAMYADKLRLVLPDGALEITGDVRVIESCESAFYVLALSARAASVTVAAAGSGIVRSPERPSAVPPAGLRPSTRPTLRTATSQHPANATPPPPHAVTYDSYVTHAASQHAPAFACWCCSTPLYWNTPQCSHCSAFPTPQGWHRTG
jgi:hypothetical protein